MGIQSFIAKRFKTFLDQLYLKTPQVLTAEMKTLMLVLHSLGEMFLQIRTKLPKVLKRTLGCRKIQIVFRNQRNLSSALRFKECLPYDLVSCVVYKFQCGKCTAFFYGETDRHLKVKSFLHSLIWWFHHFGSGTNKFL